MQQINKTISKISSKIDSKTSTDCPTLSYQQPTNFLDLINLSVSVFWAISGNVKPPEWACRRISCPPAELRHPTTASETTETGALSLVTAGTGCFDPCGSLVRDQRGSSILRQGCHSVMLLGNGILPLPIMW